MIDSTDEEKLMFAREELNRVLLDVALAGVPVLIFYNKKDLENSKSQEELSSRLELKTFEE